MEDAARRCDIVHVARPRRSPGVNIARRRMCWADRVDSSDERGFRSRCRLSKGGFAKLLGMLSPALEPKAVRGRGANQAGYYQIVPALRIAMTMRHVAGATDLLPLRARRAAAAAVPTANAGARCRTAAQHGHPAML